MLSDRIGAFEAIANSSIKLARVARPGRARSSLLARELGLPPWIYRCPSQPPASSCFFPP
jgi:hypothetical protein